MPKDHGLTTSYRHPDGRETVAAQGVCFTHALARARASRLAYLTTDTNPDPCFHCGQRLLPKDRQRGQCRYCGAVPASVK